jgi:hypothetical protein
MRKVPDNSPRLVNLAIQRLLRYSRPRRSSPNSSGPPRGCGLHNSTPQTELIMAPLTDERIPIRLTGSPTVLRAGGFEPIDYRLIREAAPTDVCRSTSMLETITDEPRRRDPKSIAISVEET